MVKQIPLVSVIIPNYNHALFLKQRIDSVLNQTFRNFELIILDDCSTDNSREIIEQYRTSSNVSAIVYTETNTGSPFTQWQKGIALASGEFIWIAESDDYADNNFLEIALAYNADFIFSKIIDIGEYGEKLDSASGWFDIFADLNWTENFFKEGLDFFKYLKERCVIPNISSVVLKKKFFEKYYNLIIDMKYCGDWLFYLTCATNGATFQYVADSTSYFRQHKQTTRWQNKNYFSPLEERLKCYDYINRYSKENPVLDEDITFTISRIPNSKLLSYLFRNPIIAKKYSTLFFLGFYLKLRQKIKKK